MNARQREYFRRKLVSWREAVIRESGVTLRHLKAGNRQLQVRDYALAIKSYKRGYLIESKPIFIHNLGLAHRLQGKYKIAISYYRNFLRQANPPAKLRTTIENLIKQMENELAQAARTKPPVEPEPRKRKSRNPLVKKPTTKPTLSTSATTAPWYSDRTGLVISTTGVIVGVVGVGLLVNASSLRSDADRELSFAKKDELNSKADTRQTWATIFGVAGVAALGVGVVKLLLHDNKHPNTNRLSVTVGFNSIRLQGRF